MIAGKSHALHKRVEQLCTRAIRWGELKRKAKVSTSIYAFLFSSYKPKEVASKYLNLKNTSMPVLSGDKDG